MTQALKFVTLLSILLFMTVMAQAQSTDSNITEAELEAMLIQQIVNSPQAQAKFQQQKDQMPKMLELMEELESCLQRASSQNDADRCVDKSSKRSKQLGLDEDFNDDEEPLIWNKNTKEQVLSEFEENIQRIQQAMPCIEKAENMMDIMECNQNM